MACAGAVSQCPAVLFHPLLEWVIDPQNGAMWCNCPQLIDSATIMWTGDPVLRTWEAQGRFRNAGSNLPMAQRVSLTLRKGFSLPWWAMHHTVRLASAEFIPYFPTFLCLQFPVLHKCFTWISFLYSVRIVQGGDYRWEVEPAPRTIIQCEQALCALPWVTAK